MAGEQLVVGRDHRVLFYWLKERETVNKSENIIFDTFDGESNSEEEDAELGSLTIIDEKLDDK